MAENAGPYTDFSVHVAPSPEDGTDVAVFGELDLATVDEVEVAFGAALDAEGPVRVDMRACTFVDSRGIAVLVKAALRLRDQDRDLRMIGVQDRVMRTFERAGVTSMEHVEFEPQERLSPPG